MKYIVFSAVFLASTSVLASGPLGIWKTVPNEKGRYLHVEVVPCPNYPKNICGEIVGVFNTDVKGLEGRQILFDLEEAEDNKWQNGEVWSMDHDDNFNANIEMIGETLKVEGCAYWVCKHQNWTRVE